MKRLSAILLVMATVQYRANGQDDPSGFVHMLNAARAHRGLAPVRHDPGAVQAAVQNNHLQQVYGLGHHYMGGFGQVAAVGMSDAASALAAWAGSPSHAAILFAPDLVAVGFSGFGGVATASTTQSFAAAPAWSYPPTWQYRPVRWFRR